MWKGLCKLIKTILFYFYVSLYLLWTGFDFTDLEVI